MVVSLHFTCFIQGKKSQIFSLEPIKTTNNKTENSFLWKLGNGRCIVPGKAMHENKMKRTLVVSTMCNTTGYWIWTTQGQITWSQGRRCRGFIDIQFYCAGCDKCITSTKVNQPLAFEFCKELSEDQNVEMGEFLTLNGSNVLRPLGRWVTICS